MAANALIVYLGWMAAFLFLFIIVSLLVLFILNVVEGSLEFTLSPSKGTGKMRMNLPRRELNVVLRPGVGLS